MTYEKILQDLKKKVYHPVYFLCGDEPFYIDRVCEYIEQNVLTDSEKEFNQSILYGKELDVLTLISHAKRYPMMSNYQVVIVKEAQEMRNLAGKEDKGGKNPLLEYILHPQKSTLLVFCYKYKSLDKRTKLYKEIEKHGLIFDSKKLYDNKIPEWVSDYVRSKGQRISPKAAQLIADYLGNDLSKVANEIDKLFLNVKLQSEIDVEMVESNIGISKEFNIFELQAALVRRNVYKANQIVNYFAANQKANPMIMTLPQLYNWFMKILTYHSLPIRGKNEVAGALGINPYFVSEYENAAKAYPQQKVINIISDIHEYDLRLKGVNNGSTTEGDLMKELVFKILH